MIFPKYCQVLISATSKQEADKISDALIQNRLIAGALVLKGPSRYWWKDEIVEREYFNVQAFSLLQKKSKIIQEVKKIHSDACPIIAFFKIDGNREFLNWIRKSIR